MTTNTRIILICSGKGGVGKTTLTANLGIALAKQGIQTAVLDADFGLRNLDLLLGLENRIVYTAQEVLEETCRLDQALVKHKQGATEQLSCPVGSKAYVVGIFFIYQNYPNYLLLINYF